MEKEVKGLKEDMMKICWFMRGGISYSEITQMSGPECEILGTIIKGNLETAKKTGRDFW